MWSQVPRGGLRLRRWLQTGMLFVLCMFLFACGGSSPRPTPAPTTTETDLANAAAAQLIAIASAGSQQVQLTWKDTFPDEEGYRIEQADGAGNWNQVAALPATSGTGTDLSWTGTFIATTTLRVVALKSGYVVPLLSTHGLSQLVVTPASASITIQVDQVEPVTDIAHLSISGAGTAASASWFVDLNAVGTSTTSPSFSISWDTKAVTNGTHLILARLQTSTDSFIEVRRNLDTFNLDLTLQVTGTRGIVGLNVFTHSKFSVTRVEGFLDGVSLGVLTTPVNCGFVPCFSFSIDTRKLSAGTHLVSAIAQDSGGQTANASQSVVFDNPAVVVLTSPIPGAIVKDTLNIQGTFTDDTPGTTLTASLGSLPILNTSTSPFSTSFSLTGVVPGTYLLTVEATDSAGLVTRILRGITVQSPTSFVYTPVVTLDDKGSFLAADANLILYQLQSDPSMRLHDAVAGTEVVLDTANLQFSTHWQISSGHVIASANEADRYQIFAWDSSGVRSNLSLLAGTQTGGPLSDQHPVAHWPWILWDNDHGSGYVLYNADTATRNDPATPSNVMHVANDGYDFFVNGTTVTFYTSANSSGSVYDVFRWDSASAAWTPLTSGGFRQVGPQTDGTLVAWMRSALDFTGQNLSFELIVARTATPTDQISLSSQMSRFFLRDGLLAWEETSPLANSVLVYDGTTTVTLSTKLNTSIVAVGGGAVAYNEDGKLYIWTPSMGKKLLLDSESRFVYISGNNLYFTNGDLSADFDKTIYRVVWK